MRRSDPHSKLLTKVRGQPHATPDDHVADEVKPDSFPNPEPQDDEHFDREPESSGDERAIERPSSAFKKPALPSVIERSTPQAGAFRRPGTRNTPESTASKRTSPGSALEDDDDDDEIFGSSQGSSKRHKTNGNGSSFTNHLAAKPKATFGAKKYQLNIRAPKKAGKEKKFSSLASKSKEADVPPVKKQAFRGLSSRTKDKSSTTNKGIRLETTRERREPSEVISDEDVEDDDLEDGVESECSMCGQSVDPLLREEFEDEHRDQLRGRRLNFQWQKRFCRFHKAHSAKATWLSRDYPDIDWGQLNARMRKHSSTLRSILSDTSETPSFYRTEMRSRLKPGARGLEQTFNSAKPGVSVGYYGPRGEKAMTDFILTNFSNEIRSQAARDGLVAMSGAQGGVSGFVQAVLVPHLAELLVSDDMNLDDDSPDRAEQARAIIAASAELGELIHPEAEDKIETVDDDDEDGG